MKDSFKKGFISLLVLASTCGYAYGEKSGEELYRQGKFKEAMDAFQKADMDHPKEVRFRYNRGCAAFQNGELDASEAAFTSVLKRNNDDEIRFRSLYNRGVIAFKNGHFHSAAEDFKEALKLKSTDEDARFNFELSLRRKTEREQKKDQEREGEKGSSQENNEGTEKDPGDRESSQKEQKRDGSKEENGREDKKTQGERPKQEEKDHSGELEGKDKDEGANEKPPQSIPLTDSQMARNKAEALLENAKDDPSIVIKMMKNQEKETSRSGKKW